MEWNKWEEGNSLKVCSEWRNFFKRKWKGEKQTKGLETSVVNPEMRTRRVLTTNYYAF